MDLESRWFFSEEQLNNSPSRKAGLDPAKELIYRQEAVTMIQDMGNRLKLNQLCINTAIVFLQRFFVFHPYTVFHRFHMAATAIFLAAKFEDNPRKLKRVVVILFRCLKQPMPDLKSQSYLDVAEDLKFNENVLLQTLGFDGYVEHPHVHVVKCCQLIKANKELAEASYYMATKSLHLTRMCLKYRPTVVACFCIYIASKWSNWEIPLSTEGKEWFWYVDKSVTIDLLNKLTDEFLDMYEKCPSRMKDKIQKALTESKDSKHAEEKSPSSLSLPSSSDSEINNPATTVREQSPHSQSKHLKKNTSNAVQNAVDNRSATMKREKSSPYHRRHQGQQQMHHPHHSTATPASHHRRTDDTSRVVTFSTSRQRERTVLFSDLPATNTHVKPDIYKNNNKQQLQQSRHHQQHHQSQEHPEQHFQNYPTLQIFNTDNYFRDSVIVLKKV